MIILGIETTCDETGVGIVRDGREVLANVVSSSAGLHQKYQGVVPEVAAREQVKVIIPVVEQCLSLMVDRSSIDQIDAIAIANGPGLVGSLLIGVETAKTLAVVFDKPLIGVNHLLGHVYANWISQKSKVKSQKFPTFPLVALIVSGGHTDLILMNDHQDYQWLGGTRDDAAGEVFDKVARVLGLGYPGGPEVERVARQFTVDPSSSLRVDSSRLTVKFPRPMINDDNFDFSFSGLKTAVVNFASEHLRGEVICAIAYEFQRAIVDVLVTKTIRAAKKFGVKTIVVGGGVAANGELRSGLALRLRSGQAVYGSKINIPVWFPPKNFSVDNGAMIAAAAFFQKNFVDPLKLQADPSLYF